MGPYSFPFSPSPDMSITIEIITAIHSFSPLLEIIFGDHHDSCNSISLKEFPVEWEETLVRNTLILQNYSFFDLSEEPVDCGIHCSFESKIFVMEQDSDFALPVNLLDYFPGFLQRALSPALFMLGPSTATNKDVG